MTGLRAGSKSFLFHYTRERVKREETEILQHKQPLFMYTASAVLTSSLMLRCTIRISTHDLTHPQHNSYQYNHTTTSDVATPQPLPYRYRLYRHHVLTFSCHLCVSQCLRLSFTPIPSAHPISFLSTLYPITHNPSRDTV